MHGAHINSNYWLKREGIWDVMPRFSIYNSVREDSLKKNWSGFQNFSIESVIRQNELMKTISIDCFLYDWQDCIWYIQSLVLYHGGKMELWFWLKRWIGILKLSVGLIKQIYSGNLTIYRCDCATLYRYCLLVCRQSVMSFWYVGFVGWFLLKML